MRESAGLEQIVVIDDDYAMRLSCLQALSKLGLHVETCEDGAKGLNSVARLKPDLVLVDLKMPGISGMEVISRIHEIDPIIVIIVITGYATIGTAVDAMKAGAYDFLPKPFKPDELRMIVGRSLQHRRLLLESRRLEMERELLKRRFITFVSHQLKTPLTAIHQYLDVLRNLGDTVEVRAKSNEWLDRCLKRTKEMREIVDDWLTLSRMEGGMLSRQRVKVDLKPIVLNVLKTYREMEEANDVTLVPQLPGDSCLVRGDHNCLSVLFDNLIANAIKYNKPGGQVTVSAEMGDGEVVIAVHDTGVGIPREHKDYLFDEFFRVRGQGHTATTGTGLGLPICKRIVRESGGTIEVESEVGVGSTFRVRLPAYNAQDTNENQKGDPGDFGAEDDIDH
ncbi:MAG: response regulator [Candidatus Krumholzibacteria bacterium]|nr:response regulator [Candidatus Krumholzibacteria bacterium]